MDAIASACVGSFLTMACIARLADFLIAVIPPLALLWAVFTFFKGRREDRKETRLAVREMLYLELIDTVHSIRRAHIRDEDAEMWGYYNVAEKVCLAFPDEVPNEFQNHNMALLYFLKSNQSDELFEGMRASEEASFEQLLKVFRNDLGLPETSAISAIGPPMD